MSSAAALLCGGRPAAMRLVLLMLSSALSDSRSRPRLSRYDEGCAQSGKPLLPKPAAVRGSGRATGYYATLQAFPAASVYRYRHVVANSSSLHTRGQERLVLRGDESYAVRSRPATRCIDSAGAAVREWRL